MSNVSFMENPTDICNWIIYKPLPRSIEGLLVGEYPQGDRLVKLMKIGVGVWVNLTEENEVIDERYENIVKKHYSSLFLKCPIPDCGVCKDTILFELVGRVYSLLKKGKMIYVHGLRGDSRCGVFISCFLMRYYGWNSEKAIDRSHLLYLSRENRKCRTFLQGVEQFRQVARYRPPITIVVSGDRESANSFRKIIFRALKDIPKGSTVIHGACRGIDTIAGEIAKELGLKVKEYPISKEDWTTLGRIAGPLCNRRMLEENPEYVLAFHPDIIHSKETKDMMISAYLQDIPVYLYDLKGKKRFKGDINMM